MYSMISLKSLKFYNLSIHLFKLVFCWKFHSFTAKEFENIDRNHETYTWDKRDRNNRGDTKLSPSGFSDHKRLECDVASVQPRAICDQILWGKEVKNIEKI